MKPLVPTNALTASALGAAIMHLRVMVLRCSHGRGGGTGGDVGDGGDDADDENISEDSGDGKIEPMMVRVAEGGGRR